MSALSPDAIAAWLDGQAIPFRRLCHEPTRTSEESARARGEPIENGAKALVLRCDGWFGLFVLSAARELDGAAVRRGVGVTSLRFASAAELAELTGLEPGSVPPFGRPLLPLDLHLDEALRCLDYVAFNAASLTESIVMTRSDYERAARPERYLSISREARHRS